MDIDKPFASYKEMEEHALKLRLRRDINVLRFENHVRALGDKDFRNNMFKGAVKDAVHDFKPMQKVTELMTGGGIASQVVMGMLTRRGGLMKRLFTSVLAIVGPNLLAKVPWGAVIDTVRGKNRASVREHNGHSDD